MNNNYDDYKIKKRRKSILKNVTLNLKVLNQQYPNVKTKMNKDAQNNVIQILNCCKRR